MIIVICGTPGSGKSTVAKLVAKKLNFEHYSMGDFQREIAEEKKISLLELSKLEEKDRSIDEEVDQRQIMLGRNKDNFVIDARLGYHFIPNSIKFYLDGDFKVRAKRILEDKIRKEHNITLKTTQEKMKIREASEKKRWKEYYNLDPSNKSNYDYIIDTTNLTQEEVADKIIVIVNKHKL